MSLNTSCRLTIHAFTELPITMDIIACVEQLASQDKMPSNLLFQDRSGNPLEQDDNDVDLLIKGVAKEEDDSNNNNIVKLKIQH